MERWLFAEVQRRVTCGWMFRRAGTREDVHAAAQQHGVRINYRHVRAAASLREKCIDCAGEAAHSSAARVLVLTRRQGLYASAVPIACDDNTKEDKYDDAATAMMAAGLSKSR